MLTRSYRTADSVIGVPTYATLEIGQTVRFSLPEPPSFNAMIDMAKDRTTTGPSGKRMRNAQSRYWVEQQLYKEQARVALDVAGWRPPEQPWQRIAITKAEFRLFNPRDPVERLAGLKWPIDMLVDLRFLEDDADKYLVIEHTTTQRIAREDRGVDLWIRRDA